jgi:hypothetical protein
MERTSPGRDGYALVARGPGVFTIKETGEMLIPMKKSPSQGEEFRSFLIEIGYITEVSKLSLKGDIGNQLPRIDIPSSYLRWRLYLPEYYGYTKFEGPLKQVQEFSNIAKIFLISIPIDA